MKNILEQLYHGEISPASVYKAPTEKTKGTYETTHIKKNDFLQKLPHELKQDFQSLIESYYHLSDLENEEAFLDGFRLGVRLMAEVYLPKDAL